jgi:hypothetical protein
MQQETHPNIILFKAPLEEAEFAFCTAKHDRYCPKHKGDLHGAIDLLINQYKNSILTYHLID